MATSFSSFCRRQRRSLRNEQRGFVGHKVNELMARVTQPNDFQRLGVIRVMTLWCADKSASSAVVGAFNKISFDRILQSVAGKYFFRSPRISSSSSHSRNNPLFFSIAPSPFFDSRTNFLAILFAVLAVVGLCFGLIAPILFSASFQIFFPVLEIFLSVVLTLLFGVFVGHGGWKYNTQVGG